MAIELTRPAEDELATVVRALRDWQRDDAPMQLHPGDLGWHGQFGATAAAEATRAWSREGRILAAGFLDSPEVFRMTVAPEVWREETLSRSVFADLTDPRRGVLPAGKASVELPDGCRLKELLSEDEWGAGDSWTPLRLDLNAPLEPSPLRIEVVESAEQVSECTAVHRSAWGSDRFTDERWHTMASGRAFTDARCLIARDDAGAAVATVTLWSAGPGRPGLLEPLGVHADHRRRGYGALICRAAAAQLRAMHASSVLVCTPTSLTSAVTTYEAAGFTRLPERLDRTRGA